jgi:hypothetical protein
MIGFVIDSGCLVFFPSFAVRALFQQWGSAFIVLACVDFNE